MLLTNLFVQVQTMFTVHISLNDIIFSQGLHFFYKHNFSSVIASTHDFLRSDFINETRRVLHASSNQKYVALNCKMQND